MSNPPKDHHYVPKCYLKPFTNFQKEFWKKRMDYKKISITNPTKVCYELNTNRFRFNETLENNNIIDEYYVETHAFKYQENNYERIIGSLLKYQETPKIIDKLQYQLFLETLLTIKRRNPSSRKALIDVFMEGYKTEEGRQKLLQLFSEETGITEIDPITKKKIEQFIIPRSQNLDYLHDMYLSAFVTQDEYTTIRDVTNDLYLRKQYILFTPIGQQFITSDNPGFIKTGKIIISLGGFGGEYEFYFPLSPSYCLYINSSDLEMKNTMEKAIYYKWIDKERVGMINNATKSICMNLIFGYTKEILEAL